jgi:hypothetical protein
MSQINIVCYPLFILNEKVKLLQKKCSNLQKRKSKTTVNKDEWTSTSFHAFSFLLTNSYTTSQIDIHSLTSKFHHSKNQTLCSHKVVKNLQSFLLWCKLRLKICMYNILLKAGLKRFFLLSKKILAKLFQ